MINYRMTQTVLIISFWLAVTPAYPEEMQQGQSLVTTGIAAIADNNIVTAQGKAITDAQQKALFQAVGTILTFDQINQQFPSLRQVLFNKAADYIESYKVLYDSTLGDRYQITLQSAVNRSKLEEYLIGNQSLAPERTLPIILLMIAQRRLNQDFYTCWWSFIDPETALTPLDELVRSDLRQQGFEVIDHTHMIRQIASTNVYGCLDIKADALQAVGKQFQADVIIIGNAEVEPAGERDRDTPATSVQASITARAVRIADGSGLAAVETYMPSSGENADAANNGAFRKAARTFAHQMGEQIALRWTKENKGVLITTLSVSGITSYIDFSTFKNALKKGIPLIDTIVQKSTAATGALLELESSADTLALAQEIGNKRFEEFSISLKRIAPPLIEAEVTMHRMEKEEEGEDEGE